MNVTRAELDTASMKLAEVVLLLTERVKSVWLAKFGAASGGHCADFLSHQPHALSGGAGAKVPRVQFSKSMSTKTRLEPQPPDLQSPWRTAARVELQLEARAFAQEIVLPIADELDPQKAEMPRSLIDQMAAKGWFGITIPAQHGGMGLGVFEYCLVSEELARAWLSVGSILARGQGLGTQTINDDRRLGLLRRSAQGK
jgi:Acyl-CoA dehydrogenase, N-terminal domain